MNVYTTKIGLADNTWAILTSMGNLFIASGLGNREAHEWVEALNDGKKPIPKPWMDKLYPKGILTPNGHLA